MKFWKSQSGKGTSFVMTQLCYKEIVNKLSSLCSDDWTSKQ